MLAAMPEALVAVLGARRSWACPSDRSIVEKYLKMDLKPQVKVIMNIDMVTHYEGR
jgi:hypothetical protein